MQITEVQDITAAQDCLKGASVVDLVVIAAGAGSVSPASLLEGLPEGRALPPVTVIDPETPPLWLADLSKLGLCHVLLLAPISRAGLDAAIAARHLAMGARIAIKSRRVLMVDDDAINRAVARDALEAVGARVSMARNGGEALDQMKVATFDVVLLDRDMPDMDGLQCLRQIRANPHWGDLPVIMMSARHEPGDAARDLALTARISKPLDESELFDSLVRALAAPRPGRQARDASAPLAVAMARLHEHLGGGPERGQRLVEGFLRDFSDASARLERAQAAGDRLGVARIAHQLRGCVGYFGADSCAEAAAQLETLARLPDAAFAAELRRLQAEVNDLLDLLAGFAQPVAAEVVPLKSAPKVASTGSTAARLHEAMALLETVGPLIASCDFAARAQLERLEVLLEGRPEAQDAYALLELFEELELEPAEAARQALHQRLGEASMQAVQGMA